MSTSSVSPSTTRSSAPTPTSPTSRTSIISPATSTSSEHSLQPLPWILHHILESQTTCELPISIMFAINSGQSIPRLKDIYSWWQLDENGKLVLAFLSSKDRITPSIADSTAEDIRRPINALHEPDFDPTACPDDRFMDRGNDSLLKIGFAHLLGNAEKELAGFDPQDRPMGLPAHFIRKYCLDQVFVKDFGDVNFGHALTALDYLRDLEFTRRSTLRKAAITLEINQLNWRRVLAGNPSALKWVDQTQGNELRIEILYSNLFLDLRIWTMTSILLSNDFNKPDALAMLNTLFPPAIQDLPNPKINPKILFQQRAIFYRYTIDVDENGPTIMNEFKRHLSQYDNRHCWPAVRGTLERYTDLAEKMIDQAKEVTRTAQNPDSETPRSPESGDSRNFSGANFDSTRTTTKTLKAMGSLTDMRTKFGLSKKSSKLFGEEYPVYSKSMVNVSKSQQEKPTQSFVDVSGRTPDPSHSTPAASQPAFDKLISMRSRGFSKPMGFVPPPLDELEEILGRTLSAEPSDYEAEPTDSPSSSPRVSFDFDAALGIGNTYRRPSLSSDLQTPGRSKKAKPNLQIDTDTITSKQQHVPPPVKSAGPLPKYQPTFTPAAVRPRTADGPNANRQGLKSRASSNRLFSASEPAPLEPRPPFATLPIKRRQIPEPAMMPEPLNINRPRKPTTPGTSNLSSFPPRNNVSDRSSSTPTPAIKNTTSDSKPQRVDLASQDHDELLEVKKTHSNSSAIASLSSNSSDAPSRPLKKSSTSSSATPRLPSDNFDFLSRPYTGSSQYTDIRTPVIMKKPSFSSFFSRKKSSTALRDDAGQGGGLGITADASTSLGAISSRDSDEPAVEPIIKKKNSMSAFLHRNSNDTPKTDEHDDLPTKTPKSAKTARFDDNVTSYTTDTPEEEEKDQEDEGPKLKTKRSFNFATRLRSSDSRATLRPEKGDGEKPEPKLKKKSNFAFGGGLRSSESSAIITPQETSESGEQSRRGLQKMSSFVFGSQTLRNSDSQATLRPEPRVLKKKKSVNAVGVNTFAPEQAPQIPALRKQPSSFAVGGPVRPYTANSEVGLFAQFEAEEQGHYYTKGGDDSRWESRAEFGVGGPVRPSGVGSESGGAYTRYPVEEGESTTRPSTQSTTTSLYGTMSKLSASTSQSSATSPTSPLQW
ncbi:hypothetical protein IFR05_016363, partial [Cadophora sp. M221]